MKISIDLGPSKLEHHNRLYSIAPEQALQISQEVLEIAKQVGDFQKWVEVIAVYPYPYFAPDSEESPSHFRKTPTTRISGKVVVRIPGEKAYSVPFGADTQTSRSVASGVAGALYDARGVLRADHESSLREIDRAASTSPIFGGPSR